MSVTGNQERFVEAGVAREALEGKWWGPWWDMGGIYPNSWSSSISKDSSSLLLPLSPCGSKAVQWAGLFLTRPKHVPTGAFGALTQWQYVVILVVLPDLERASKSSKHEYSFSSIRVQSIIKYFCILWGPWHSSVWHWLFALFGRVLYRCLTFSSHYSLS